jgi:hypothetical protein
MMSSSVRAIRQFAEEQLVTSDAAESVRTAHAHYFARREADVLALWGAREPQTRGSARPGAHVRTEVISTNGMAARSLIATT